jgi:RNA polymerase sigma-B factor
MAPKWHARASVHQDGRVRDLWTLLGRCSAGDLVAREAVIIRLLPYARSVARRYSGRGEPLDDLYQAASVGLIKAVDRYDPERGVSFLTYAQFRIVGEIRNHFRAATRRVHVPRSLQDRASSIARARDELRAASGSEPTPETLATHLDISVHEVTEAEHALRATRPQSLDSPATRDDPHGPSVGDQIGQPEPGYERVDSALWCRDALQRLQARERDVVLLRFGGELTQDDIARRVGVSQMQVSRILRSAVATMTSAAGVP